MFDVKNIAILGSTGSIGVQTLDVVSNIPDKINVVGITANKNIELLENQIRKYKPKYAAVMDYDSACMLKRNIKDTNTKVEAGLDGLIKVATASEIEIVLTSVVGMVGLLPTYEAIKANKDIALANKETLVAAGSVIMDLAKKKGINIIPVDSEHSAIFQCLQGNKSSHVKRIILTASGGPFFGKTYDDLKNIKPDEALKHPNWDMGKKISIDSATLMNKGLELIEARWIFKSKIDNIDIVIHPQSIIHSMVEYIDNSVIAQLSIPDMKIPIQYALTFPERKETKTQEMDFTKISKLTFDKPDLDTFRCLRLAIEAARKSGTAPVALNSANEIAVEMFLNNKISFTDIAEVINKAIENHEFIKDPKIDDIIYIDDWVRDYCRELVN